MPAHWNSWKDWGRHRRKARCMPHLKGYGKDGSDSLRRGRLRMHREGPLRGTGRTYMQICHASYWRPGQKPDIHAVWPKRDLRQERRESLYLKHLWRQLCSRPENLKIRLKPGKGGQIGRQAVREHDVQENIVTAACC